MAACKYCGDEISWEGEPGAWRAVDPESGERHFCPEGRAARTKTPARAPARQVTESVVADPFDLIQALNRLAAEVKELRRVIEEQRVVV